MTFILELLKSFFNWLKDPNHQRWFLIMALVIAVLLGVQQCNNNKALKNEMAQNEYALRDTIHVMNNKLNELYSTKAVTVGKLDDLKKFNDELYKEVKKMKGDVAEIAKVTMKIQFVEKTIVSTLTKYPDGSYHIDWADTIKGYKDYYRELVGTSMFKLDSSKGKIEPINVGTKLSKDFTSIDLVTGLWKSDVSGKWEIFVRNSNPNVKFQLNGHVVQDKIEQISSTYDPVRWHIGFYAGVGMNGPMTPDWYKLSVGYQIGFGIQYTIWDLNFWPFK